MQCRPGQVFGSQGWNFSRGAQPTAGGAEPPPAPPPHFNHWLKCIRFMGYISSNAAFERLYIQTDALNFIVRWWRATWQLCCRCWLIQSCWNLVLLSHTHIPTNLRVCSTLQEFVEPENFPPNPDLSTVYLSVCGNLRQKLLKYRKKTYYKFSWPRHPFRLTK